MEPDGKGPVRLDYEIPARGLIGFQNEFKTPTQGSGLLFHVFDRYGPKETGAIAKRLNGVMIANAGANPAYSLGPLQERGKAVRRRRRPGLRKANWSASTARTTTSRSTSSRTKPLTNMRASGKPERRDPADPGDQVHPGAGAGLHRRRRAGRDHPKEIRLRKKLLTESDRKRASRAG